MTKAIVAVEEREGKEPLVATFSGIPFAMDRKMVNTDPP
jgi:hypothetical protein